MTTNTRRHLVQDQSLGKSESRPETVLPAVERVSLKDHALLQLRTAILSGRLDATKVHSVGSVAEQLGMSRTPAREALIELEMQGLVRIIRSVGFRVIAPSMRDIRDTVQVRQVLEGFAMNAAAGRLTTDVIIRARELLSLLDRAGAMDDLEAFISLDAEFHNLLTAQAGNRRLGAMISAMRDTQWVPRLATLADTGRLIERNADHGRLLAALIRGNRHRARQIIKAHVELNSLDVVPDLSGEPGRQ